MNLHSIPVRRLLAYWLPMFVCAYVSNLFLYTVYQISVNGVIFVLLQATTPLLYLLFGWLYFRRAPENDWSVRIFVAVTWILLTILGTAILMQPVYGYPWTSAVTSGILKGQAINVAAILVAGWVGKK